MRATRWLFFPALACLAGAARAEVPILIAATGHATVPVHSDAFGTRQFVLDTGAGGTALYEAFSRTIRLERAEETIGLVGQTGSADLPALRIPSLSLDGTSVDGIDAVVLPNRADGIPLAGIVGLDLFGRSLLDFDLPHRRAALHPTGTRLEAMRDAVPIDAALTAGDLYTIEIIVDGVAAVAVLDTGARKTRINWRLGRMIGLDPATLPAGDVIQGATGTPIATSVARVRSVGLGGVTLRDAPVFVTDLPVFEVFGVADRPAVILGMDWLERARMIVDFPARKVWFLSPQP
ncbi:MAG: aspartyl protease family protein [Allosphingosinicella sp.]